MEVADKLVNSRKGLLMRVGIDQTAGKFNAPINPLNGDFLYIPIPESKKAFRSGMETTYEALIPGMNSWNRRNNSDICLPAHLHGNAGCHLDPDFEFSTYGDQARGRGARVVLLNKGDFILFFASFKPTSDCQQRLVCALFGIMVVDTVLSAANALEEDFHKNAHTRVANINPKHLVVYADPTVSGRFNRAIPIGEMREGAYRVTKKIHDEWGVSG